MQEQVLQFWFEELEPKQWWVKDTELDAQITQRFGELHQQAIQGELHAWRGSALGSLAEVIVLDQFSRNIFRDTAGAFAADPLALALSQTAIERGYDRILSPTQRSFLYMPYMHSESKLIHSEAVQLFEALGISSTLEFEFKHKAIIDRFGRYPHRNAIVGRDSTAEELAFLEQPDSSF